MNGNVFLDTNISSALESNCSILYSEDLQAEFAVDLAESVREERLVMRLGGIAGA